MLNSCYIGDCMDGLRKVAAADLAYCAGVITALKAAA